MEKRTPRLARVARSPHAYESSIVSFTTFEVQVEKQERYVRTYTRHDGDKLGTPLAPQRVQLRPRSYATTWLQPNMATQRDHPTQDSRTADLVLTSQPESAATSPPPHPRPTLDVWEERHRGHRPTEKDHIGVSLLVTLHM